MMIHLPGGVMPTYWNSVKIFLAICSRNWLPMTIAEAPGDSLLVTASVWSFWNMGLIFLLFPPFSSLPLLVSLTWSESESKKNWGQQHLGKVILLLLASFLALVR